MISGDFMRATVYGTLPNASNPVINTWDFECIASSDFNALQNIGADIVASFMARYYDPLRILMHQEYRIQRVELREYGDLEGGYDGTGLVWHGASSGIPLPPFVTYNVQLVRSEFDQRSGRKGFAGCNSAALTGLGGLNDVARNQFNLVFGGWRDTEWTVEAGAADYSFQEVVVAGKYNIKVVPAKWTKVSGYSINGFGTQNSRK